MKSTPSFRELAKKEIDGLKEALAQLSLPTPHQHYLHARYLLFVDWTQRGATQSLIRYYAVRLVTIVAGALIPGAVSLKLDYLTIALGLATSLSAGLDGFFRWGERWRHYRSLTETLKAQGWLFVQLAGPYRGKTHGQAFADFADWVERTAASDVETYVSRVLPLAGRPDPQAADTEPASRQ